jgi:signal transduction histidine kinase
MKERVSMLGSSLDILSSPSATSVCAVLPASRIIA